MNNNFMLSPENQILSRYGSAQEAASAVRKRQGTQFKDSWREQADAWNAYNSAAKRQSAIYAKQIYGDGYQKQVDQEKYNELARKLMRGSPLTPEEVSWMREYVSENNVPTPTFNNRPIGM